MLTAALGALAWSAATWAMLESRQQEAVRRGRSIRMAAENAALRGLAELQQGMGPDVAYDFESSAGRLSSASRRTQMPLTGEVEDGSLVGRWSVADLSLRHDVSARSVASSQSSAWAVSPAGRAKLPCALAGSVASTQAVALAAGGPDFFEPRQGAGTSWQVRGLLTDPVRGGWRKDLSAQAILADELGSTLAALLRSPAFAGSPAKGLPLARVSEASRSLDTLPILADLRLSLGFFNSRSDGRHRVRFHGTAVFWNRLSVPVLAGPQGKIFLVEFVGSPEVTITNLETQSSFVADLDDCPQEDFGVIRQGLRERGLWFWAEVTDPATYGMAGRGLLPGEVYALVNPSPAAQPQGLARILTRTTWKLDRTYHGPGWKRPEPTVFLPTDQIEIAVRFRGKVGIRLRPYAGEPLRDVAIGDYPARPVISLDNLVFPDFLIRTTGEDYSRDDSSGYTIEERRACLRVRLRPREANELWSAAAQGSLSKPLWDLMTPADAAEWVVDHPVRAALDVVDYDTSPLSGPLWDSRANRHDGAEAGAFAAIRMRDVPAGPLLSVGALRHLEPPGSTLWWRKLDDAFCSAPPEVPSPGVLSSNPFLISVGSQARSASAAGAVGGMFTVGPFNVNSRDAKAWELFLADASGSWKPEGGGPFEPQELAGPIFFTRPAGAALPKWGATDPVDLADEAAALLPRGKLVGLSGQQCVRSLLPSKLPEIARRIVDLQPSHGWPYPSLEAFAGSRILEDAFESAGVDDPYATMAPALPIRLQAGDLLEAWAPVLTVRGDTFSVVGMAQGEGGVCVCELIVQRIGEEHPVAYFGRRFRIISARFRNR